MKSAWKRTVVIFILGLLLGSAGSLYIGWRMVALYGHGKLDDQLVALQVDGYTRRLKLTADQKQKVESLLRTQRKEERSLSFSANQRRDELRHSTDKQIKLLLNPEQIPKFAQMVERSERRIHKFRVTFQGTLN